MVKKEIYIAKCSFFRHVAGVLLILVAGACSKSSSTEEGREEAVKDANLISITIKTKPVKSGYFIGEAFVSNGLMVEGIYDDGKSLPVSSDKLSFAGFDSGKPASQQTVQVTYEGKSTDLVIEIYPFQANKGTEITAYVENEATVVIPEGITKIAEDVFVGKRMTSIVFPSTLQEIGGYAFFSCPKLESVTLPASLRLVGEGVFDNCASLVSADLSKTILTDLGDYMFNRCPKLSDVKLPLNVIRIGHLSFCGAVGLKIIALPANTRYIGLDAFRESGLEKISLPNNIKVIRQRAFLSCHSLAEVTVYGTFVPVEDELVPILESSSFQDVPALVKFGIPQGVTLLDQTIISNCPLLSEITIPASVERISFHAFLNTVIKRVIVQGVVPAQIIAFSPSSPTYWNAFPSSTNSVEVPESALEVYKQALGWSAYANLMKGY